MISAYNSVVSISRDERYMPGDEQYPYLVARDKTIAERIKASTGFDEESGIAGAFCFGQQYGVLVIPAGVSGSWADGTFESFLLAPWAYCMYQQRDGAGNVSLSYCDEFVNVFYQDFYRCGAGGILDGDGNWGDYETSGNGDAMRGYGPAP